MSVPPELGNKADVPMLDILEKQSSSSGTPSSTMTGKTTTKAATTGNGIIGPTDTLFGSTGHHNTSDVPPSLFGPAASSNGRNQQPIVISMSLTTPDEYYTTARPSRESVLQRLSEALLRRSLTKIDLSQRGLRPTDAKLVKMALSQNANLAVLKLGYNNLGDVGVTTLAAGIAIHRSLASLDLGFNNVGDEGCKALASAMIQQQQQRHHRSHNSNSKSPLSLTSSSSMTNMATESDAPCSPLNEPQNNATTSSTIYPTRRTSISHPTSFTSRSTSTGSGRGTLRTLYLAGNLIGEDGALAMADCIRRGSSLRKLYMTGNRIGSFGVKALTEAIVEDEIRRGGEGGVDSSDANTSEHDHPNLSNGNHPSHVISIGENKPIIMEDADNPANDDSDASVMNGYDKAMSTSMKAINSNINNRLSYTGLKEIFLGGTGMGSSGCQAVAGLLEKSGCLTVLSLPNCNLGDEEVCQLARSIKANRAKLPIESLQLSFNNITYKGLEALMNSLWGSSSLKELRLDNNEIGDRGAHHVAAILPYVKTLELLDVGFNAIKTAGLNTLMRAVAETAHLRSLSVSGNALDVAAAKAVAYALAYNRSLKALHLVHCSIGHEGTRHISAGVVSNSRTALRKLTGFEIGPVIVTLGFPAPIEHWTNEQVLNFVHLMWEKSKAEVEQSEEERELDPLSFLPDSPNGSSSGLGTPSSTTVRNGPLEATIVVEVAKKAYEALVANGVDVFSRRKEEYNDPSFGSPLVGDAIMVESPLGNLSQKQLLSMDETSGDLQNGHGNNDGGMGWNRRDQGQARSFVAEPESNGNSAQKEMLDPDRKKRIVEWLCSNIRHLNEFAQKPFDSRELWKLHQHYFTPVVNECGGAVVASNGGLVVSSVPEGLRGQIGGSAVAPSTQSTDNHRFVPMSDTALPSPMANSLPMLKRKVSYRFLGDAMLNSHLRHESRMEEKDDSSSLQQNHPSVAKMIEDGHTGHSMPPKTKRARRNRTRISFVPRIKQKLDSYLDVCHEKALVTMRQLYFVEQAILGGAVNPVEPASSPRTHLNGVQAKEAEMIIVDMI